jgi:hypothetical protein
MRFHAALLAILAAAPLRAAETHQEFRAEAEAAYQRKDYAAARAASLAALALRPDSPRYLHNVAATSALLGDKTSALDHLQRLAALGVAPPIERDPDFASLQGTPEFVRLLRALAENRAPRGQPEILAELPGRTGIIEGIAYRARTGDVFLGDVHHRCIWKRDRDGRVTRFTAEDDELLGIFGLAIDEPRNTLWAAMTAVPEMEGYTRELKGHSALAAFNLSTSELIRIVEVPGDGRDRGAEDPEKIADSPRFSSLQGLVLEKSTLLVADYANGLFSLDLASGKLTALVPPPNSTLLGLDGLVAVPGGVIATQNGVEPQRLVRIGLNDRLDAITSFEVLASGHPQLADLTLATLVDGVPTFVAGAGWEGYDPELGRPPRPHTVRLVQVPLP